jgi:hypothetical protein
MVVILLFALIITGVCVVVFVMVCGSCPLICWHGTYYLYSILLFLSWFICGVCVLVVRRYVNIVPVKLLSACHEGMLQEYINSLTHC